MILSLHQNQCLTDYSIFTPVQPHILFSLGFVCVILVKGEEILFNAIITSDLTGTHPLDSTQIVEALVNTVTTANGPQLSIKQRSSRGPRLHFSGLLWTTHNQNCYQRTKLWLPCVLFSCHDNTLCSQLNSSPGRPDHRRFWTVIMTYS